MQIGEYFFGKKLGKITHGRNFTPKVFRGPIMAHFWNLMHFILWNVSSDDKI